MVCLTSALPDDDSGDDDFDYRSDAEKVAIGFAAMEASDEIQPAINRLHARIIDRVGIQRPGLPPVEDWDSLDADVNGLLSHAREAGKSDAKFAGDFIADAILSLLVQLERAMDAERKGETV